MTVKEAADKLGFKMLTSAGCDKEIKAAYTGDLLSWVMGKAPADCAWITICGHINIIAVALLVEAACIIVAEDAEVDSNTLQKAESEEIPVLITGISAFEAARALISIGL